MDQEAQEEQQDEEGAGVEGVHAGDHQGEQGQRQGVDLDPAEQGQVDGRGRRPAAPTGSPSAGTGPVPPA